MYEFITDSDVGTISNDGSDSSNISRDIQVDVKVPKEVDLTFVNLDFDSLW